MLGFSSTELIAIGVALMLGGLIKGVTGAGAPVIAIPIMASFVGLREAVALMVLPNMLTNIVQVRQFWTTRLPGRFPWVFAASGCFGAGVGTLLLVQLPATVLMLALALIVIGYVALRVLRPAFVLAQDRAMRLAPQVGIIAGIMQGAVGISAPISVSFLNAMRLDRSVFIPTVAIFFIAMSLSQTSVLVGHGVLTSSVASVSLIAMMGQLAAMALGNRLARNMSAQLFDRIVLVVLLAMAARMIWTSLSA